MAGVAEDSVKELMTHVHAAAVGRTHISEEILMDILEEVIQDRIACDRIPIPSKAFQNAWCLSVLRVWKNHHHR